MPWRRLLRTILAALALAIAGLAAFVLWSLFWPAPGHAPTTHCRTHRGLCAEISGRVLYHTTFAPGRHAHVVLLSRSSVTLPGVSSLEFPQLPRAPAGLGVGDWVVVTGRRATGSHHEHDFHVYSFATSAGTIRCGVFAGHNHPCRPAAAH